MPSLIHIGLGYNHIRVLTHDWAPRQLVSLDLCWNEIIQLEETVMHLKELTSLRNLVLMVYVFHSMLKVDCHVEFEGTQGNPIRLSKAYKPIIVHHLPWLYNLDDENVTLGIKDVPLAEELRDEASKARLGWRVAQLTGLTRPVPSDAPEPADVKGGALEPPPNEYRYAIQGRLSGNSSLFVTPFAKLPVSELSVDFQGSSAANCFAISASTLGDWKGVYFLHVM